MKTLLLILAINVFYTTALHATSDTLYPEVGKPCPAFVLKNIAYYNKKTVTLADFKGKWLVLDFWNKYCSSCISSFPKMNAMQKKFGDRVQIMLVGLQDAESKIKPMYERFKERMKLTLPCAFDSALSDYWGIYNTPHIVVIDDKGIVRARTFVLDSNDVQAMLNGASPVLNPIHYVTQQKEMGAPNIGDKRIPFDLYKPYMVNDNGARSNDGLLYRSVLAKYDQVTQETKWSSVTIDLHSLDPNYPEGMFQAVGISLRHLYPIAYFGRVGWDITDTVYYGKYAPEVILEVTDSSLFQTNHNRENMFSYSVILPPGKGSKANLQKAVQRDLATNFGFDVLIEVRKLPCWRLVNSGSAIAKLVTKGGEKKVEEITPHVSYKFSNIPMWQLIRYLNQFTNGEAIFDETAITHNIDITTECMDFESMQTFLPRYGLKLIRAEKEMKVLVIRDPKN